MKNVVNIIVWILIIFFSINDMLLPQWLDWSTDLIGRPYNSIADISSIFDFSFFGQIRFLIWYWTLIDFILIFGLIKIFKVPLIDTKK
jgi:hypothetical protein